MTLLFVVIPAAIVLTLAYLTYGALLQRLLRLDATRQTPAYALRDDVDYAPISAGPLLSQHFSAIAAAGPIVGPILAGVNFGWGPALCWILVGCVFVGGVHDMAALVASIRHQAKSIAEVVRDHMSRRAFMMFLAFVWLALVYIIVAFTDLTAQAFVTDIPLEGGLVIRGAGIASSSLMYLALPIAMGVLQRYAKLSDGWASLIFVPLVGVAIFLGQQLPFDLAAVLQQWNPALTPEEAGPLSHKVWDVLLLLYCCVASVTPMWLLLQPRGALGGYFLYAALFGGAIGLVLSNDPIQYPMVIAAPKDPMLPILFITIACGACSGFHALIASGTTSKQLKVETDARRIGYGAMLLEGMVAVISLCCVMRLSVDSPLLKNPKPDFIYATGIGSFLQGFGLAPQWGIAFAMMAFTTFVYDTIDVCTRLGRYIIQELTGLQNWKGRWLGTLLTAGVPVLFVTQSVTVGGKPAPLWRIFWSLFGASNQLLAALTLLGITIWLWRTRRETWVWLVTGIPTVWMYVMSTWALVRIIAGTRLKVSETGAPLDYAVLGISLALVVLAALMLLEAIVALFPRSPAPPSQPTREGLVLPATST